MGIRDSIGGIFGKIKRKLRHEDELDLEMEPPAIEEQLQAPQIPTYQPPTYAEPPQRQPEDTSTHLEIIKNELANIKSKLELLQTELETLESGEKYNREASERYMQYLSYINQKLDILEKEHEELEKHLRRREEEEF